MIGRYQESFRRPALYDADTLLDELHDDETPRAGGRLELDEDDDTLDLADELDDDLGVDDDLENSDDDESLLSAEDTESWSDDPVRMYLTQMGEIPLLTRQEEIALAKQIEITRAKFRRKLLECDYVMQQAVRVLGRVHDGDLPFDRTVQVSVTDRLEKEQILGRLPHNLRTLKILLRRNRRDYRVATSKSRPVRDRREAWRRLGRCRKRAVRLIEELGLRTQRIEPLIGTLEEFSRRVDELRDRIDQHRQMGGLLEEREAWTIEFRNILRATQETPDQPAEPDTLPEVRVRSVSGSQTRALGRKPPAGRLDRQEVSQPRAELPGLDPGGQRRPDAGGRQVRVSPRVQVLHLCHLVDSPGDHPRRGRPEPDDPHPGPHGRDHVASAERLPQAAAGTRPREPTIEETARASETCVDETRRVLAMSRYPISLDRPVGNSEDSHFGDLLPDGAARKSLDRRYPGDAATANQQGAQDAQLPRARDHQAPLRPG